MKAIMFFVALTAAIAAQAKEYPFTGDIWKVSAAESAVVQHLGEQAIKIKGGYAQINDLAMQDGLIEFDIAVSTERGFAGAIFRVQDLANYEHFYIRPHQAGKADANQYTPVFNGVSAWQLYHGERYATPLDYSFDKWMHIRIAYAGDRAEVYLDSDEPVLLVDDLRRDTASGGIGLGAGNFAPAYFANVEVSPLPDDYRFKPSEVTLARPAAGTVMSWQVSAGIAADDVADAHRTNHTWTTLEAENSGITNLAKAPGVGGEKKTVVARLTLHADSRQQKKLTFGYSDEVTVYVNGTALYAGSNRYQSRDFRYLGTIGLFDSVFLPLEAGDNEVLFVVTEAFGGWGIQAQFEDLQGVSLK